MTKKNLKVLILLSLISIFIFLITGCSSDSEDALSSARSYDVNFEVTDKTPQPVAAAELTLAGETKTTNGVGVVSFRKADGRYKYEVSASGYKYFSDYIVVKGANTINPVELTSLSPGDSEPGDTGDEDTTSPRLVKLFGWINENFHGVEGISSENLEDIFENLDPSFDYFIVYFSEEVKTEAELVKEDFEVHLISVDPNEKIIIEDAFFNSNTEFLVLKIDQRFKLDGYKGLIRLKITNEGREKITDIAGNMLAEEPDSLFLKIE